VSATESLPGFDIGFADGITPVLAVPERPVPDGVKTG